MSAPYRLGFPRIPAPTTKYDRDNEAQFRRIVEQLLQGITQNTNDSTNNKYIFEETLQFRPDNTVDVGDGVTPYRPRSVYAATSFLGPVLDSNAATDLLLKRNAVTQLTLGSLAATFAGDLTVTGDNLNVNGLTYAWPASQAANRVLRNTGPGTLAWSQVDLSTDVTGALAGGTVPAAQVTAGTFGSGDYVFPSTIGSVGPFVGIGITDTSGIGYALEANTSAYLTTRAKLIRAGGVANFIMARVQGTLTSPSFISSSGVSIGQQSFQVYNGTNLTQVAAVLAVSSQVHSAGNLGTRLDFTVTANGASTNTTVWRIDQDFAFKAVTDNTYDIGASGATRPRTGYFGTSLVTPLLTASTRVTAPLLGTTSAVDVVLDRNSVTQLTLGSLAATFAGTVSTAAPTGGSGAWKLGVANAVSPTAPNRTLTVEVGGTTYYIHAKLTND